MTAVNILAMLITLMGIGISVLGRGEHHKVSLKLPLNGVLFAIGAAVCQGVGLVLSKIGMDYYETGADMPEWLIPFSANF
jgi:drug/metabolite transporter (DMT)-like permease